MFLWIYLGQVIFIPRIVERCSFPKSLRFQIKIEGNVVLNMICIFCYVIVASPLINLFFLLHGKF